MGEELNAIRVLSRSETIRTVGLSDRTWDRLENRIGRRLQPFDFIDDQPFNDPTLPGTRRRFERLTGAELVEGLDEAPETPAPSKLELALQTALGKRWEAV